MAKRRAKGEGGISPIHNAEGEIIAYQGSIELTPGTDGKRRRKKVRAKTRQEVARKMREERKRQDQGVDIATKRQPVSQFLAHWLKDVISPRAEPKTIESYEDTIRRYIDPHVGAITLDALTVQHCQEMYAVLRRTPDSRRPTRLMVRVPEYAVKVLERALNRAIEERLIMFNPAALVVTHKHKPVIARLDERQARAFLIAINGHPYEGLLLLLILCGLRQGEGRAVTWADVDLVAGSLTINKTTQRIKGLGQITKKPKTENANRIIAIPTVLLELLGELREKTEGDGLIFTTDEGKLVTARNLDARFKGLLKRAGLPESTTLHGLRHTCATLLLDAGENIVNVADLLGHKDANVTAAIYGHAVKATQARGVQKLSEKLTRKKKGEE